MNPHYHFNVEEFVFIGLSALIFRDLLKIVAAKGVDRTDFLGDVSRAVGALVH